jgi:signal-transduction protein with cAMP-binding, CBS, and nucleotidyltransferase domain
MSKNVITVLEAATAKQVAISMSTNDVGSVIVTKDGHPVGIITERDLVERVMAKSLNPETTLARLIMSSPLSIIDPNSDVMEAARRMARLHIRRLLVVKRGDMVGMITSRDILSTAPELIEVIMEASHNRLLTMGKNDSMAGYCDQCEEWSDTLKDVNGQFLCEECRGL